MIGHHILRLVFICTLLLVSLLPTQQAQAYSLVTEEAYWHLVEVTYQTVLSLEGQPEGNAYQALLPLSNQWAEITQVNMPNGTTASVSHSYFVSLMRASPPDVRQLRGLLEALRTEHTTSAHGSFGPYDAGNLRRILGRSEFQWKSDELNPLVKGLNDLWDRLDRWLGNLFAHTGLASISGVVFAGLGAIALLIIILFVLRRTLGDFVTESRVRSGDGGEENLTADTALKRAQAFSNSGDYRTAVRYLYLSALLMLEERGLLRYDRAKTNREYLRSLASKPDQADLAANLQSVVDVFDQVWYGFQPLDETSYAQYVRQVKALQKK